MYGKGQRQATVGAVGRRAVEVLWGRVRTDGSEVADSELADSDSELACPERPVIWTSITTVAREKTVSSMPKGRFARKLPVQFA